MIYDSNDFNDLHEVVMRTVIELQEKRDLFDSILVRGVSGLVVGSPVAMMLKVPLCVVRKPDESSHQGRGGIVNVRNIGTRCVFLDDFQSSGATEREVTDALTARNNSYSAKGQPPARIIGAYFYQTYDHEIGWQEREPLSFEVKVEQPLPDFLFKPSSSLVSGLGLPPLPPVPDYADRPYYVTPTN